MTIENSFKLLCLIILALILLGFSSAESWEFSTCGAEHRYGPDPGDCPSHIEDVEGYGYQIWTIPQDGIYSIEVEGAQGGDTSSYSGGEGARIVAEFDMNEGEELKILVGQEGQDETSNSDEGGGGGGASMVMDSNNDNPLVVAGGGGGAAGSDGSMNGGSGSSELTNDESGGESYRSPDCCDGDAGAGAGFGEDGEQGDHSGAEGRKLEDDGRGGDGNAGRGVDGGFGGGGATDNHCDYGLNCNNNMGGGGGMSGGDSPDEGAEGGRSYIDSEGTEISRSSGHNSGHGSVEIELVTDPDDPVIQDPLVVDKGHGGSGDPPWMDIDVVVDIDDDDGDASDNELEYCEIEVTGQDNGGTITRSNSNPSGDECDFEVENDDHSNWETGEEVEIEAYVEDSYDGSDSLSRTHEFPYPIPEIIDISTTHFLEEHAFNFTVDGEFNRDNFDDLLEVEFENQDGLQIEKTFDSSEDYMWREENNQEITQIHKMLEMWETQQPTLGLL